MKLLFTHRYFWPDTAPYAAMLRSIAEDFANAGHDVHVFASKPSYRGSASAPAREDIGQIHVRRTWVFKEDRSNPAIRLLNVLLYCGGLFARILRTQPDVVTASTFPPIMAAWSASVAAKLVGARFIYHMQDIHPEVSRYSGGWLGRGLQGRLMTWLDNQTLRRSAAIVVLSEDMANTLRARKAGELPIHVINNFLLDDFGNGSSPPAELRKTPGKRRIIFAGNLGRFQNLPLLAEGVALCFEQHPELELFFLGDGSALAELQARWSGHPQVRFAPFLPFAQARELIAESDIGLVSLAPNIYRVAYPSKVLTYLGLGVPILAVVEPESMLASLIRKNGLGAIPQEVTAEAIHEALDDLLGKAVTSSELRCWYQEYAPASAVLPIWHQLFHRIA